MILEAIFNGEIYPAETVVPKSEKFREAGQAIADTMRYFEQTLSKEDYAKRLKFLKLIKEFTDLLSSILAELFMMEFISREIRYQMKMDSVLRSAEPSVKRVDL